MILKNAEIYNDSFDRVRADIAIQNGKISAVGQNINGEDCLDCTDCVILPGFVDIHTHGCMGRDATDGKPDSVAEMSRWLVKKGVTSFCPTTMTVEKSLIEQSFGYVASTMGKEAGAYILGINMEGPFISPAKKGAQAEENIIPPDFDYFNDLFKICPVSLVDIAPEVPGAESFIKKASALCAVSAAHTVATYEQAKKAFDWGLNHITHLYNAMHPLLHRAPGPVGAVLDDPRIFAEIICDGIHIDPAVLRFTFKALGENRTVVISDSVMAAGLCDGEYTLGGQKVFVKNGTVTLADGTVAGSTTNLFDELQNLLHYGIPEKQAIKSLTLNPARSVGADGFTGSIAVKKNADLVILSPDLSEIRGVFVKGIRKV